MPYIGNPSAQRFTSPRAASVFSGDGSTVAFTLEEAVTTDEDILVSVDGVIQEPSVAYAVSSGTTLTFTAAPSSNSGNNIFVYYIARTFGSVSMPDGQNVNAANFSASGTGAITGNATVGGTLGVTGIGTFTDDIIIGDGKTIGSASDVDAMTISSGGVVNFTQIPTVSSIQLTNAPAFEVQRSGNQTISDNSNTKVQFNNEIFDSDSKYDHSTNYRFTPTVAGKYFVYANIGISAEGDAQLQNIYAMLYKNGSQAKVSHFNFAGNNARFATGSVSGILTLDSDDYVEAYVQCADSSGSAIIQPDNYSTFGAYKMIGI